MDIVKLLPLIFSLLSRGGEIAGLVKQLLSLIDNMVKLFKGPGDPVPPALDLRWLQQALTDLGYNVGGIDGLMGPKTQKAIEAFQKAEGLEVDGWAFAETIAALLRKRGAA